MNFKLFILIICFLATTIVSAQNNFQAQSFDRMQAQTGAYRRGPTDAPWAAGVCEFEAGSCNGADVSVYDDEDQKVFSATLTSRGEFQTLPLKKNKTYKLILTWKRFNIIETRMVRSGDYVTLNIAMPLVKNN